MTKWLETDSRDHYKPVDVETDEYVESVNTCMQVAWEDKQVAENRRKPIAENLWGRADEDGVH